MEARICDRCGTIWKDAKNELECGVYVQKIAITSDRGKESIHLCATCLGGLYRYLSSGNENKED